MWILYSLLVLLYTLTTNVTSSFDINGELIRGLPCVKRLNQLYCNGGGNQYPEEKIAQFVDDNKALMKRMFGELQIVEPPPLTHFKIPASTTYVRTVRNYQGTRFSRSVQQGFLEEILPEGNRTKRQADFPGSTRRGDPNKIDACESITEVTTPYWATNSNGEVRAIVNSKTFSQAVHQEICGGSKTLRCAGDCACEQKYQWHRLLSYDPNNDCSGIFMDWFLFPSCCTCRCLKNDILGGA